MSVGRIKSGGPSWDYDAQARSNKYLKEHGKLEQVQPASFYTSSISSLTPTVESSKAIATPTESIKAHESSALAWLDSKLKAILDYFGGKSASTVNELDVQQDHVKKFNAAAVVPAARSAASKASSIKQPENKKSKNFIVNAWDWTKNKFNTAGDWIKNTSRGFVSWVSEKWDSFLITIGFRRPPISTERDRAARARITERRSPVEIEDDFKYLDIATTDPLKVMLALLVRQGELREEQAHMITQRILLMQEDLKDIHNERMHIQGELALINKRNEMIEKVTIGITVAQVLSGMVSTAAVVAGAATIATGGAAAPFLIVTGVLAGVVSGAQGVNTLLKADSQEKLDKVQADMLVRTAKRDEIQFQLKIDVKDMKKILGSLTGQAEIGSALLAAQYGK